MDFTKELERAKEELLRLEKQKTDIERQMRGWIQVIEGLLVLNEKERFTLDPPPTREEVAAEIETPSLPNMVLGVLCQSNGPIPAPQIRDELIASRAVDASAKNLLINIHTTLKRLIKTGQVEELPFSETTKLYRFISPMEQALKMSPVKLTGKLSELGGSSSFTVSPKFSNAALKAARESMKK